MFNQFKKVFCNKVVLYMITRYIIYGLQFVLLLVAASKMGPFYYGIWGFFLMLLGYFGRINFGIANSTNVFLVQNKNDLGKQADYVVSAIALVGMLALIILFVAIASSFVEIPIFEKYHFGNLFYVVCFLAILEHFNILFCNIYRVKNKLLELSIYQSMTSICMLIAVIIGTSETLLYYLVASYIGAHLISLIVFVSRNGIPFCGKVTFVNIKELLAKGFFLFLYNSCFYLILTTTSNIISYYYTVEEYGMYTFSYSLGHSVLLLLEAFTFIVFPKVIDKFYSSNMEEVKNVLNTIRVNYVTLSHGLMYCAFAFFPVFIVFFPAYQSALPALYVTSLAILLYTNSFGYNTFLIARNKEITIAKVSFISLMISLFVGVFLSIMRFPFYSVVFCVMISYFVFAYLCTYYAKKIMVQSYDSKSMIGEVFPVSLFIPYVCGIIVAVMQWNTMSALPLILFLLLNMRAIKDIVATIKLVLISPKVIDIKR